MQRALSRREFLRRSSFAGVALGAVGPAALTRASSSPNEKVIIAVIGCHGRGMDHIAAYLNVPAAEIGYICDVDKRALQHGVAAVAAKQQRRPEGFTDLRRLLEQKDLDAVSIATPDHWHAPAAILACAAGKHVYVEKPGSHNLHESRLLVAAARKHRRVVQMGNQRRSWPWVQEAIAALHAGELGELFFARTWYTNHRPSIGHGRVVPVPPWLDWSLWQGPAPEEPFRDNLPHYNWHWFWTWGTGELGNNGVHALDVARWGLRVDIPRRVTCGGNRYHFQDDWQTPDTCVATFDFGNKGIVWEGQSCDPRGFEGATFGINFYGEHGTMSIAGTTARVFDLDQKLVREIKGRADDVLHFANFVDAIRRGIPLRAEIEDAEHSTRLCHLGNISWRTGDTLDCDPVSGDILHDKAARALERRRYRHGWEPKV
ncbi:MAG TPA: Gfo/Idh/MocA family oxidoreductase [Verrucomicrobiae bacterium]|nr:Gfo/Idh/MocA family oxidoreductase [Verrucomicrobiae bacterium]